MTQKQKQLNELRVDFNKHQSETKEIIKKKIYEIKKTTQEIKEELNKDMEDLRKKNQIEILEIKSPFNQIKIQWKATPQSRTSGRQNPRAQR
jgi:TRAP-type C4-dicarboxylate transport system substrate-binding protein